MAEISLESLYHLVENMADYLMTKVVTKEEFGLLEKRFDSLSERVDSLSERVDRLSERVDVLTERVDRLTERVDILTIRLDALEQEFHTFRIETNQKFDRILEGMDAQAAQLDILRTELASQSHTLDLYNVRIGDLEETVFGKRVRDERDEPKDAPGPSGKI